MEPSSLAITKFSFFKRHSTISIMDVYWLNTMALLAPKHAAAGVPPAAIRLASPVLVAHLSQTSQQRLNLRAARVLAQVDARQYGFRGELVALLRRCGGRAAGAASPGKGPRVAGQPSRGTRHVGHVTFFPVSGAQDICVMHSRWNTCLHPVMAASSGSTASWHIPQ